MIINGNAYFEPKLPLRRAALPNPFLVVLRVPAETCARPSCLQRLGCHSEQNAG